MEKLLAIKYSRLYHIGMKGPWRPKIGNEVPPKHSHKEEPFDSDNAVFTYPALTQKQIDTNPYSDWPDWKRMEEFAHTGDPSCLTPELARRMKLGHEFMLRVPGATEDDIKNALLVTEENEKWVIEETDKAFSACGFSYKDIISIADPKERLIKLLPIAALRIASLHAEKSDDIEYARGEADLLIRNIIEKEDISIEEIVKKLPVESIDSVKLLITLHEITKDEWPVFRI